MKGANDASALDRRQLIGAVSLLCVISVPAWASVSDRVVDILNREYGNVCSAKIEGWFSKTLVIDWTGRTTKIHAVKVLAEISGVKQQLYDDGVRYFKFPNDGGGYNIIDWKTGEKTSVSDKAPYYFR